MYLAGDADAELSAKFRVLLARKSLGICIGYKNIGRWG